MNNETIIQILMVTAVISIIIITSVLLINTMQQNIDRECSKLNYTGIIKFADCDINCSAYKKALENQEVSDKMENTNQSKSNGGNKQ